MIFATRARQFPAAGAAMARTYADAVASLNTLQSNWSIIDAIRKSGGKLNDQALPEVRDWCRKIGYQPSDFNSLKAIHIAGTKGKGSTAAFVSSILNQFRDVKIDGRLQPIKTGLYTSPHLRFVRERIQIDGTILSEEQFSKLFFEIWDRLEDAASRAGANPKDTASKPVYFRFLTLMALHAYKSQGIDAAVIECGIGGAFDTTNILERPSVTCITSLGIDHVQVLGGTLAEIAWHKAGIMKKGVKCFTPSSQLAEAKAVMERVAKEKEAELIYVDIDPDIECGDIKLGLQAEFQKINASLAVAVAKEYLSQQGIEDSSHTRGLIRKGLEQVSWPGRCETRREPGITWCIDGGHTLESIELAGKWFASQIRPSTQSKSSTRQTRFLIFNQQRGGADELARALHTTLAEALKDEEPFTNVIFCTNTTFVDAGFKPDLVSVNTNASDVGALTVQKQLAQAWANIDPAAQIEVVRTIEEAVLLVRAKQQKLGEDVTALVTGSLHLVGGFLEVLESGSQS